METREKLIFQEESLYLNSPKTISDFKIREEEKENLLVYLAQDTYQWMDSLINTEPAKEVVGVLLGQVYQGENGNCIIVDGAMEAKYTEGSQDSPCFTHESWEDIYALKESKYPEKRIVGWFRTSSGMNLSTYDLMVQKGFFKHPWQVLYVLDSQAKERGFFRWKGKEIIPCPFFHLFIEKRPLAEYSLQESKGTKGVSGRKRKKAHSRKIILRRATALSILLTLGGGLIFVLYSLAVSHWNYLASFFTEEQLVSLIEIVRGFLQDTWEALAAR